ncbi:MAG TPA: GAF and ANTAR domain-containing protein [Acidimicrobiales bacterium]|jgi:GAF domain-containing protein|nr:GAF and ANTAR domain-containing protein [Acidimicrobiales bacterium]
MAVPTEGHESLIALAGILVAEQSLEKTLGQVLDLACAAMPGGDLGGVTLLERGGPTTAVATNEAALRIDMLQYAIEAGPCLDAYRNQTLYRIDDTDDDERWPEFVRVAAEIGVGSTLSLPLVVAGDGMGALNIYCLHTNGFSDADEVSGLAFASYASVALANARVFWRTQALACQLQEALTTRGVIEQAKGILIAQQGCSPAAAFDLLVRASQRSHTKLHDVAVQLVERARSGSDDNRSDDKHRQI